MGALTQAPKHSTSDIVNNPSDVVCPTSIPNLSTIVFKISSEPLNQQGVVVHTCK